MATAKAVKGLRLLHDNVAVLVHEQLKMSKGGIHMPETGYQGLPYTGVVRAVGPGKRTPQGVLVALEVKVGDKIMFTPYEGKDIKHDGETLKIIPENVILAAYEGEAQQC